jgi:hypothetical protein
MDDEIRRREAARQGRQAYMQGKPRNPAWPTDFLEAYDRAQDEDDIEGRPTPRISRGERSQPIDVERFKVADE